MFHAVHFERRGSNCGSELSMMNELPQLRMRHFLKEFQPLRSMPEGYVLREASEGDAIGIAAVLESSFLDRWSEERVMNELLENVGVPETYIVEANGVVVGTASYQHQKDPDPEAGWLHYVGVLPEARGFGLGEVLSQRVLIEALARGNSSVYLTTDDPRVPAIKTYLKLGFKPDNWHESHEERWLAIRAQLSGASS